MVEEKIINLVSIVLSVLILGSSIQSIANTVTDVTSRNVTGASSSILSLTIVVVSVGLMLIVLRGMMREN